MPRSKPKAFSEAERKFWDRLRDYIHQSGGWITSEPHTDPIRFECLPASSLPELLRGRGYDVVGAGSGERLLPSTQVIRQAGNVTALTVQNVVPTVVEVYQFQLPFE
jgi:hypothetical protein